MADPESSIIDPDGSAIAPEAIAPEESAADDIASVMASVFDAPLDDTAADVVVDGAAGVVVPLPHAVSGIAIRANKASDFLIHRP